MKNRVGKPYAGLDIGKFLCALLILFYHYFSEHGPVPRIIDEALSLYAIAVALFMAISGFLTFDKLQYIQETSDRWKVVKKQVIRILTIYVLWSIPYLLYTIFRWDWSSITIHFVFWQVQGWIFKSTFFTIWFMPMLAIGLVITFWMTEKFPDWVVYALAIFMYIIGSLTLTYSHFGKLFPGFAGFASFADTWLGGSRGWLFYAFPLLIVGRAMVKHKCKIKWSLMMILSCFFVGMILCEALLLRRVAGHTGIDMTVMMIPSVYCILGFLISINIPYGPYCTWMRKMSTLIFMSQRLFLTVLPTCAGELAMYIFKYNIIGAVIVCGSVFIFSCLIIILSKRINLLKLLF